MPTIRIRRLPDHVYETLRLRAARSTRSVEDEARAILIQTCSEMNAEVEPEDVQDWVAALYANRPPKDVAGDLIAERRRASASE